MSEIDELLDNYGYTRDEIRAFLNDLRDSGETNMYGAGPYLVDEFDISRYEAKDITLAYMKGEL